MIQEYLIISPHTKDECLPAMDAIAAKGDDALEKWKWGCMGGDHTGYETIQASSVSEALNTVPEMIRDRAHAVRITKMTPDQLQTMHESYAL